MEYESRLNEIKDNPTKEEKTDNETTQTEQPEFNNEGKGYSLSNRYIVLSTEEVTQSLVRKKERYRQKTVQDLDSSSYDSDHNSSDLVIHDHKLSDDPSLSKLGSNHVPTSSQDSYIRHEWDLLFHHLHIAMLRQPVKSQPLILLPSHLSHRKMQIVEIGEDCQGGMASCDLGWIVEEGGNVYPGVFLRWGDKTGVVWGRQSKGGKGGFDWVKG
ncbi:hypothetical protein Tco_1090790 [Tanacetum coccineum]|uniref:Uncharacterized protein n=1 Tax=Tanacetum coccineum TaxID=301880 RepID=A0ABQ5I7J0_9ASTR